MTTTLAMPASLESASTAGTGFGLDVTATVAIPGLLPRPDGADRPRVSVALDPTERPPGADPRVQLLGRDASDGTPLASIHYDRDRGYRIFFAGYGTYDVAADGSAVVCHPPPGLEAWRWQQFLFAQTLPFAAVLNGLEPLHASAVAIDGRVIAFAGGSGAGKSSLALELAARGAGFLTDDVLTVSAAGAETICHAGAGIANVRDAQLRRRAESERSPFSGIVGVDDESVRVLVDATSGPLPLGSLYVLERGRSHSQVRFEAGVDPVQLLGHTFNAVITSPTRLARQLDVCARLNTSAVLFRVSAPAWLPAGELAALITAHAAATRGGDIRI